MKIKKIITIFLVCIVNFTCSNKDVDTEKKLSSLKDIPSIEGYQNLKLTDVEWKLIGFIDAKQNELKIAEPEHERCYRLRFNDDNTLSGESSTNEIVGTYEISLEVSLESSMKIISLGGTKINELYDGNLYMKCLKNVNIFSMTEKGLALYYDSNKFLLFIPFEQ